LAKFKGRVGYAETVDTGNGIWEHTIVERIYSGDITRNTRRYEETDKVNDNYILNNEISLVADPYAFANFHKLRWIELFGEKWRINTAEVNRPRIKITVGGVWNGQI